MNIYIRNQQNKVKLSTVWVKRVVRKAVQLIHPNDSCEEIEVSILIVNDKKIQELNKLYLNRDSSTDVIAFPVHIEGAPIKVLGDIVISAERAKCQAEQYNHSLEKEIALLLIHGLLHLSGYTDNKPSQRRIMWKKQEELLDRISEIQEIF